MEGNAGLQCLAADADIWKLDQGQLQAGEPLMRARAVQRGLLPQEQPSLETLDYAGHCIQAKMVGGDYYDFLDMGTAEVGIRGWNRPGGYCGEGGSRGPADGELARKSARAVQR